MNRMYWQRIHYSILRGFSSSTVACSKGQTKPAKDYGYGLDKAERKHLRRRIEKARSTLNEKHIYKEVSKIESSYQLAEMLIKSEIYNDGGLVGLIKPFGIRRYKEKEEDQKTTVITTINSAGYTSMTSIEEALPLLKKHYDCKDLEVLFTTERFTSGILLLSLRPAMSERVRKSFRRSKGLQVPYQTYWAVVHGLTMPEAAGERVGMHTQYVQNIGEVPLIKKAMSKNEVFKQVVKPNIVEHLVLMHHPDNDVSLVEVNVMQAKHHFVRVWLAHCMSPVLGDRIFGGRVRMVMGKRILVSPNNYSSYQPPEIPKLVLEKLDLPVAQAEIIPPHVHLSKLKLQSFHSKGDLVLTVPPPDYFAWSCKQLSLMNDKEHQDEDQDEDIEIVGDGSIQIVEDVT